jgi:hypothetical protein
MADCVRACFGDLGSTIVPRCRRSKMVSIGLHVGIRTNPEGISLEMSPFFMETGMTELSSWPDEAADARTA